MTLAGRFQGSPQSHLDFKYPKMFYLLLTMQTVPLAKHNPPSASVSAHLIDLQQRSVKFWTMLQSGQFNGNSDTAGSEHHHREQAILHADWNNGDTAAAPAPVFSSMKQIRGLCSKFGIFYMKCLAYYCKEGAWNWVWVRAPLQKVYLHASRSLSVSANTTR